MYLHIVVEFKLQGQYAYIVVQVCYGVDEYVMYGIMVNID